MWFKSTSAVVLADGWTSYVKSELDPLSFHVRGCNSLARVLAAKGWESEDDGRAASFTMWPSDEGLAAHAAMRLRLFPPSALADLAQPNTFWTKAAGAGAPAAMLCYSSLAWARKLVPMMQGPSNVTVRRPSAGRPGPARGLSLAPFPLPSSSQAFDGEWLYVVHQVPAEAGKPSAVRHLVPMGYDEREVTVAFGSFDALNDALAAQAEAEADAAVAAVAGTAHPEDQSAAFAAAAEAAGIPPGAEAGTSLLKAVTLTAKERAHDALVHNKHGRYVLRLLPRRLMAYEGKAFTVHTFALVSSRASRTMASAPATNSGAFPPGRRSSSVHCHMSTQAFVSVFDQSPDEILAMGPADALAIPLQVGPGPPLPGKGRRVRLTGTTRPAPRADAARLLHERHVAARLRGPPRRHARADGARAHGAARIPAQGAPCGRVLGVRLARARLAR